MRQITKQHPVKAGEYRYLRCFTVEHNLKRLSTHVQRLQRKLRGDPFISISRLKNNHSSRARVQLVGVAV